MFDVLNHGRMFWLEDAVYMLTGALTNRFGLSDRGRVSEGVFADVVVFDPQTICDRATYQNPHQHSVGVEHVLVNGTPVVADGLPLEEVPRPWPEKALRCRR